MSIKIGTGIETERYGTGTIIEDIENLCDEDEVLVEFDNGFWTAGMDNSFYTHQVKEYIEIINIKDLIFI